jgi:hypothetical protein
MNFLSQTEHADGADFYYQCLLHPLAALIENLHPFSFIVYEFLYDVGPMTDSLFKPGLV